MNPIVKNGNKIRCEFKNVKSITESMMYGNTISIGDIDWSIVIRAYTEDIKYLSIYLRHESEKSEKDKNWLHEAGVNFKLLSQTGKGKSLMRETNVCYQQDVMNYGFSRFIKWEQLEMEDNGYLKGDSIVVEVEFDFKCYDFSKKLPIFTDITLNAEETDFHVNKAILCSKSEYFYDLVVNKKSEDSVIKLDDIKAIELCYILASLSLSFEGINEAKFREILRIADKFKVSSLHHSCEQFLIKFKGLELIDKIKYFEMYGYEKLMKFCIDSLKTGDDIKNLYSNVQFSFLKETTKLRIMQRFLDIY